MIGIDTNVIVRYVTQDDAAQTAKAVKLIQSLSKDSPGFVTLISMVELAWVLESGYDLSRIQLASILESLLQIPELIVEKSEIVLQAIRQFKVSHKIDFADCLIAHGSHAAGCLYVVTFDRHAAKASGMKLLV